MLDPDFLAALLEVTGIPRWQTGLVAHLNKNLRRRFKIDRHVGKPFHGDRGAGQGDTFSLLGALSLTNTQVMWKPRSQK